MPVPPLGLRGRGGRAIVLEVRAPALEQRLDVRLDSRQASILPLEEGLKAHELGTVRVHLGRGGVEGRARLPEGVPQGFVAGVQVDERIALPFLLR